MELYKQCKSDLLFRMLQNISCNDRILCDMLLLRDQFEEVERMKYSSIKSFQK